MTVALWGGGTTDDLAERIRTGDVAIDLYRPVGLVPWYLAGDLGRAAYHFLTRGAGARRWSGSCSSTSRCRPRRPRSAAFLVSLVLAVTTSFAIRFLVACSAFWLLDQSGVKMLSGVLALFFSGMVLPLVIFPEPLRSHRARAAVGVVPPDARGHLARQARRPRPAGRPRRCRWCGPSSCSPPARRVLAPATRKVVVQGG